MTTFFNSIGSVVAHINAREDGLTMDNKRLNIATLITLKDEEGNVVVARIVLGHNSEIRPLLILRNGRVIVSPNTIGVIDGEVKDMNEAQIMNHYNTVIAPDGGFGPRYTCIDCKTVSL